MQHCNISAVIWNSKSCGTPRKPQKALSMSHSYPSNNPYSSCLFIEAGEFWHRQISILNLLSSRSGVARQLRKWMLTQKLTLGSIPLCWRSLDSSDLLGIFQKICTYMYVILHYLFKRFFVLLIQYSVWLSSR